MVHGPLQAIALAEVARRFLPDRALASFSFRAMRPAFDGHPLRFAGRLQGDELLLTALDHDGHVTVRATAGTERLGGGPS